MEGFGSTNDWSLYETEVLECTFSQLNLDRPDWMEVVAARLPNKTVDQVRERYMDLLMAMECLTTESPPQPNYTNLLVAGGYQEPPSPTLPDFASPSTFLAPSPALPDFGSLPFGVPSPTMTEFGSSSYMQPWEGSSTSSVEFMLSPPAMNEEIVMLSPLLTEEEMKLPSEAVAGGSEEPVLVEDEEVAWSPPVAVAPPAETVWSPPMVVAPPAEMVWSSPMMVENEMEASPVAAEVEIPMSPPLMFDAPLSEEEEEAEEKNNVPPRAGASTKGLPWTEEEHRLFLIGMDVHGRGNWRGIAKNFVITRSSTQVASHAQKYFNRRMEFKQKRRPSIHDITSFKGPSHRKPHNLSLYDIAHWNKSFRIPRIYQAGPSTAVNNRPRPCPRLLVPNAVLGDGMMRSAPAPKNGKGKQPYDPYAPSSSKNYHS